MARTVKAPDGTEAKRGPDTFSMDPLDLVLVWPERHQEMGPHDITVKEHPEAKDYLSADMGHPLDPADVDSYVKVGQIMPRVVRVCDFGKGKVYVVIAGRTGVRCMRKANELRKKNGAELVPTFFRVRECSSTEAWILQQHENLRRKDRPSKTALAYEIQRKLDEGMDKAQVLAGVGLGSWRQAENYLAFLRAPEPVKEMVESGTLPMVAAVEVAKQSEGDQVATAEKLKEIVEQKRETKHSPRVTMKEARAATGKARKEPMSLKALKEWQRKLKGMNELEANEYLWVLDAALGGSWKGKEGLGP